MALVLLMSSGLMIRTFAALRKVDPGFADPQHLRLLRVSIPNLLIAQPERVTRTQNAILDKLAAIQGVKSVGFASGMPMEGVDPDWDEIFAPGQRRCRQHNSALATVQEYLPLFLTCTGTRLGAGREMTWSEIYGGQPEIMVSENWAREM